MLINATNFVQETQLAGHVLEDHRHLVLRVMRSVATGELSVQKLVMTDLHPT